MTTPPEYLTLSDAARFCGRTGDPASLAKWTRRHLVPSLPVYRVPGSTPILKRLEVQKFIEAHRTDPIDLNEVVRQVMGKGGCK